MASLLLQMVLMVLCSMATGGSTARIPGPTMNQLFTIDETCTASGYDLEQYLDDLRTLLASGRAAIANLKGTTFFRTTTTRNYMRNAHNTFGTEYYPGTTVTGLNSADTERLAQADCTKS